MSGANALNRCATRIFLIFLFKKDFIYSFLERGREEEREENIDVRDIH